MEVDEAMVRSPWVSTGSFLNGSSGLFMCSPLTRSLGLALVSGHARSPGELHRDLLVLDTRGAQQQDAGAGRVRDAVTEQF